MQRLQNVRNLSDKNGPNEPLHDYNFVLTKKWMFLVLRREPHLNGIHCNSLGYLGLLFVKDEEKKELLESKLKPIELLQVRYLDLFLP